MTPPTRRIRSPHRPITTRPAPTLAGGCFAAVLTLPRRRTDPHRTPSPLVIPNPPVFPCGPKITPAIIAARPPSVRIRRGVPVQPLACCAALIGHHPLRVVSGLVIAVGRFPGSGGLQFLADSPSPYKSYSATEPKPYCSSLTPNPASGDQDRACVHTTAPKHYPGGGGKSNPNRYTVAFGTP